MGLSGVVQRRPRGGLAQAGRLDSGKIVSNRPRLATTQAHPPPGFRARRIEIDGEVFVVASYPIEAERKGAALTEAERAVAEGALSGKSNAEIARHRRTSTRTVANLLARVFAKLGVGSRLELAARWERS